MLTPKRGRYMHLCILGDLSSSVLGFSSGATVHVVQCGVEACQGTSRGLGWCGQQCAGSAYDPRVRHSRIWEVIRWCLEQTRGTTSKSQREISQEPGSNCKRDPKKFAKDFRQILSKHLTMFPGVFWPQLSKSYILYHSLTHTDTALAVSEFYRDPYRHLELKFSFFIKEKNPKLFPMTF